VARLVRALGLVGEREGVAARVLLEFGAEPRRVRSEVVGVLSGPRRRGDAADVPDVPSHPEPEQVAAKLQRLGDAKERAIVEHEFERAAALRDRERRLKRAVADIARAVAADDEAEWRVPDAAELPAAAEADVARTLPRVLVVGALLVGAAGFALGLLVGLLL
jgi:hypothetical protein